MKQDVKEKALKRLATARGHLEHVISMVNAEKYCMDILQQSLAVQSALRAINNLILENHLKTCAADAIGKGRKEEAIAEVMQVFKKKP